MVVGYQNLFALEFTVLLHTIILLLFRSCFRSNV